MKTNKPRIFISSTIYDFSDLRSALKYWLTELGFDVLLSEHNDFIKDTRKNSFEACLDTIRICDYFILLIGSRVGGFYDEVNKISITRMEYRAAYQIAKTESSNLRLLVFVRDVIWNIKEDRAELFRFLKNDFLCSSEIKVDDIQVISNHKSKFLTDSAVTFSFLDEVSRKKEMKAANKGLGEFPVANWIHTFKTFDDLISTMKTEFLGNIKLDERKNTKLLKDEITENLKLLLSKSLSGKLNFQPIYFLGDELYKQVIERGLGFSDNIEISVIQLNSIALYSQFSGTMKYVSTAVARKLVDSGDFIVLNPINNILEESVILKVLKLYIHWCEQLRKVLSSFEKPSDDPLIQLMAEYKGWQESARISVPLSVLIQPLAIYGRYHNVYTLSFSLYLALEGYKINLENITLLPQLLLNKDEKLISDQEVLAYLSDIIKRIQERSQS